MSGPSKPVASFNPWRLYVGTGLACAVMAFGVYALGVRPAADRRDAAEQRQTELRFRREKIATLTGALEDARRRTAASREAIARLPLKLAPCTSINQRLANLTDLANSTSVKIDQVQPGQPSADGDFQAVPIRIAGTGTYPASGAFLHRLRSEFPDTAVHSFGATSGGTGNPASFHFDLVWHTLPDHNATASIAP